MSKHLKWTKIFSWFGSGIAEEEKALPICVLPIQTDQAYIRAQEAGVSVPSFRTVCVAKDRTRQPVVKEVPRGQQAPYSEGGVLSWVNLLGLKIYGIFLASS